MVCVPVFFESGFYYYRARYYWPEIGRFLERDPIGFEDQMNLYAYVGNSPLNATDPTGRQSWPGMQISHPTTLQPVVSGASETSSSNSQTGDAISLAGAGVGVVETQTKALGLQLSRGDLTSLPTVAKRVYASLTLTGMAMSVGEGIANVMEETSSGVPLDAAIVGEVGEQGTTALSGAVGSYSAARLTPGDVRVKGFAALGGGALASAAMELSGASQEIGDQIQQAYSNMRGYEQSANVPTIVWVPADPVEQ